MVDLLKDWNPNRYLVDVVDDEKEEEIDGKVVIEEDKNDEEFDMMSKLKDNWAKNVLSSINKLIAFEYDFTQKEIIYSALTIILIAIVYFILFSAHHMLKPQYPPPQEIYVKLVK